MDKMQINISEDMIRTVILGFLIAFFLVVLGHFSPSDWKAMPMANLSSDYSIPLNSRISTCTYKCFFNERYLGDCSSSDISNFSSTQVSFEATIHDSFEHLTLVIILGIIASIIIHNKHKINIKIT